MWWSWSGDKIPEFKSIEFWNDICNGCCVEKCNRTRI